MFAWQSNWTVRNTAADLYPFLVMAAFFTDRLAFERDMHEILRNEVRHTTRLGALSDDVKPGDGGFAAAAIDIDRLIFGSCEYVKDGLLPLTELLGHHAWHDRMISIVDEIITRAPYETPFGRVPSRSCEVNGEFLQALTRLALGAGIAIAIGPGGIVPVQDAAHGKGRLGHVRRPVGFEVLGGRASARVA